jgi:hypothetical protein
MNAMDQIVAVLCSIPPPPQTPQERRRAKNRRYYESNKFIWEWYGEIRKLRKLRDILIGGRNANH